MSNYRVPVSICSTFLNSVDVDKAAQEPEDRNNSNKI